jgi:hypothetical protein
MSDNRRALLRGIAYSSDPGVSARDRLEALARLDALGSDDFADIPPEVRALNDAFLDEELDRDLAGLIFDAVVNDTGSWPILSSMLRAEVERRADEISDTARIKREIAERVEVEVGRRVQMYVAAEIAIHETAPAEGTSATDESTEAPRLPDGIDPWRGWPNRRKR